LRTLNISCRPYHIIQKIAERCLESHGLDKTIPVPIEELLDVSLGIHIVPFPNLTKTREINAYLTNNLKSIYVDEYLFFNLEKPLRFTLAHEFGHFTLHHDIYSRNKPKDSADWIGFIEELSEIDRTILENEADNFAGLFLVPEKYLQKLFADSVERNKSLFIKACKGRPKSLVVNTFLKYIAEQLSNPFMVSPAVIEIRARNNGLLKQLYSIFPPG